jgi:hypothetical protein
LLCAFAAGAMACSDAAPLEGEAFERTSDAIINGTPDTAHPAVVLVAGNNSACSGTIVHKNGSTGHVLSAAHCGAPQYIIQGQDYNNPDATYVVIDYLDHPSYNGQAYDFMMVRFTGAGSGTPVIPAMSPAEDNLQAGTQIRHVGYGKSGPPPGQNNTIRREILGQLSSVSALLLTYNQPQGGPCQGDSGGPQLTLGTERVAGVTSAGDPNCASSGYSGRVSAVFDTFVMAYINNAPIGGMNCDQCTQAATTGMGGCMTQVNTCFNDNDCNALLACFDTCSTQTCYNQCFNDHPSGGQLYLNIIDCVCDTVCPMECGMEAFCQGGGPAPTTASASTTDGSSAVTGAGGGAVVGAGSGAAPSTGTSDNWIAGETPNQEFDGQVVASSGCGVARSSSTSRPSLSWPSLGGFMAAFGAALAFALRRRAGRVVSR